MKNINWKQSILTALITILVTVSGGMILYYLQFHKAEITYSIEEIPPFKSQNGNVSITHIKIVNSGSDVAEDIKCEVIIFPAHIEDYNIDSDSPIEFQTIEDSTKLIVTTKNLNESEKFQISLLLNAPTNYKAPEVKLRAKGINGLELEEAKSEKEELPFWKLLALISGIATSLTLSIRSIFKSKEILSDGDETKHSDDQNQIIAYLCGLHGLEKEVDRLLSLPESVSYWSEVDRLSSKAIISNDNDLMNKIVSMLIDLLEYASISDSSKGIVYYNLARLEKKLDNLESSNLYLVKAKSLNSGVINSRIKLDPVLKENTTANKV